MLAISLEEISRLYEICAETCVPESKKQVKRTARGNPMRLPDNHQRDREKVSGSLHPPGTGIAQPSLGALSGSRTLLRR